MAEKQFEHEDPFEFVHVVLDGLPAASLDAEMTRTFVEEYMAMGWTDEEIYGLFSDPFYRGTHEILERQGEAFIGKIIREVRHGESL